MGEFLNIFDGRETEIALRKFEKRDVDSIFKWKNDKHLLDMIIGQVNSISYEDATLWVENCMKGDRSDLKFWAICTNDDEKRIVGWTGLSQIDESNKSACQHGLVIGDNDYRDGTAMFEAMLLSMQYVFQNLKLHRLYGNCLSEHNTSPHLLNALGYNLEGREKDAFFKNERYYDVLNYALLENDYKRLMKEGRYKKSNLIKLFIKSIKGK